MSRFLTVMSVLLLSFLVGPTANALEPVKVSTAVVEIGYMFEEVRKALNKEGYDAGPAGPKISKKTMAAYKQYNQKHNLKGTFDAAKKLGIVFPRACFWIPAARGQSLLCPDGCKSQLAATQDRVTGYLCLTSAPMGRIEVIA
ncbi:MAG: hypothetical protein O3A84_13435 [Proteobacteria bacterium]|nr:hypothetical protein [Pseudomonadota bacterium]